MARYAHHGMLLACACGARVRLPPAPHRLLRVGNEPVLTESDLTAAVLTGCPQTGSGQRPCARIARIEHGRDSRMRFGGDTPLTDDLTCWTDGLPPNVVRMSGGSSLLGHGALRRGVTLAVIGADGAPISDEWVRLTLPDGSISDRRTDPAGNVQVDVVEGAVVRVELLERPDPLCEFQPAAVDCIKTRGAAYQIDRIVIHSMDGTLAGTRAWFGTAGRDVPTATHYLVGRGGRLIQMVPDDKKALHAGSSQQPGWNDRSIGIEHEVRQTPWGKKAPFPLNDWTPHMLDTSARLVARLCRTYGIPANRQHIVGHSDVPGATHVDPGPAFPWARYLAMILHGVGAT